MASKNDIILNFKENNEHQVIFTGKYMEVYLPESYFESNMASYIEDRIRTLGIFMFRTFSSEDKKEKSDMKIYKLPTFMEMKPSESRKEKLNINGNVDNYTVLQFYTNDIFLCNTAIEISASIVNEYITFFHKGKVPSFIKYDDLLKLELDCITLNKMKFPVPSTLFEIVISEINRDKSDISKSFRFAAAEGANKKDYQPVSIQQIPSFNSTFTSVTFEDIDYQLISSVNKTRYNKKEAISPLEKTIKY